MHADMNRQVRLVARPRGIPQAEHFALVTEPVATPGAGEILIRNHYLSVDPAQRGWANDEGNYSAPVPLNSPMRALAVGEILKSNAAGFRAGEFVYGWFGWQTCCVATPEAVLRRVSPSALPLSANLGLLGINGLTAYLALHRLGDPKPGEHVLVSTAAGSVGSFVGQLAQISGCHAVGLTSSSEKAALAQARYGYRQMINYRDATDLAGRSAKHALTATTSSSTTPADPSLMPRSAPCGCAEGSSSAARPRMPPGRPFLRARARNGKF